MCGYMNVCTCVHLVVWSQLQLKLLLSLRVLWKVRFVYVVGWTGRVSSNNRKWHVKVVQLQLYLLASLLTNARLKF